MIIIIIMIQIEIIIIIMLGFYLFHRLFNFTAIITYLTIAMLIRAAELNG